MSSRASNALAGLFPSVFTLMCIADAGVASGGAACAGAEVTHDRSEHVFEHLGRQPSRIGVVTTAMIAIEQTRASIQWMMTAMREGMIATGKAERAQCCVV